MKKLLITLGSFSAALVPVATAIACGNTATDNANYEVPSSPDFDEHHEETIDEFKQTLVETFVYHVMLDRSPIDTSSIETATSVSTAHEAAMEINDQQLVLPGGIEDISDSIVIPPIPVLSTLTVLEDYQLKLVNLFAPYFIDDGTTPIDTSSISSALDTNGANSAAQVLKSNGVFTADEAILSNPVVPDMANHDIHSEPTIESYRVAAKAVFNGLDIDLSFIDEANTVNLIRAAIVYLLFENGLIDL